MLGVMSNIETGVIAQSFPDRESYTVYSNESGLNLEGCMSVVGGLFAPFFGFKTHARLSVGTPVLILMTSPALILSCIPGEPANEKAGDVARTTTGPADISDLGSDDSTVDHISHRVPKDLLEGEYMIGNALQIGVKFLTHLVKMHAGERAKVECFLMNDLVRVVSGAYRHLSDFGEYQIYNDGGRLNVRQDGTSYEHEAAGLVSDKDPRVKGAAAGTLPTDPIASTGRWRFSQFVGYLGDFIHMFVTDPGAALGELAQERSGKFHAHVNQDGSLIVQSLADIVLERVVRITVPVELKAPDDPTGDKLSGFPAPDPTFMDTWELDRTRPWTLAYHIRDYARWLNSYHSYARYLQQNKDWQVKSEASSPAGEYSCKEVSKEAAIAGDARVPRVTYSCIRILRDGSQVLLDGYGGSIMQAGGTTTVSSPVDIRLEAGRDIVLTAGRNIFGKARRNVELVAVTGALIGKACTRLALWCERGTILLKTLMTGGDADTQDPPAHRFFNNRLGVIIDAPNSDVLMSSGRQMTVEGVGKDLLEKQPGVRVQTSQGNIEVATGADGAVRLRAKTFSMQVETVLMICTKALSFMAPYINFGDAMVKSAGKIICRTFIARRIDGETISHKPEMKLGRSQHTNHVYYNPGIDAKMPDKPDDITAEEKEKAPPAIPKGQAVAAGARCDYLAPTEYPKEPLPQSLTQQIATVSNPHPSGATFEDWTFAQDAAKGDPQAAFKLPYPGQQGKMEKYASVADLYKPATGTPDTFKPKPTEPPSVADASFKSWKAPTT